MTRKLIIASAGAGKTYKIVKESIQKISSGSKVLLVTYTINNQAEIIKKFKELGGKDRDKFHVKGLFTFLLEDIIRPYQHCIFENRIETINFDGKSDPHKYPNKKTKPGTGEIISGLYNPIHYLTSDKKKAYTTYLSQLGARVIKESNGKPIARLEEIYSHIYFDEVQDLVGWDYEVLKGLAESKKLGITCVGDFRQTIYDTVATRHQPKTTQQKLECFEGMKFVPETMNISRRSLQCICDIADKIHANEDYKKTQSIVKEVPTKHRGHCGVFIVKGSDSIRYIKKHKPTLLRGAVNYGKKFNHTSIAKVNFGKSKGLGFSRVLVLSTKPYIEYLKGSKKILDKNKTEESKNKLYVAMTRAKYSLGFIIPDEYADKCGIPVWVDGIEDTSNCEACEQKRICHV